LIRKLRRLATPPNKSRDTGTPVDDRDYQLPFKFTGKLNNLTRKLDRPKLTPEDIKKR
jgi:arylsulfatase